MARGWLRIYLGAAPGVGKTYAMLNEGLRRRSRGTDVVVGLVETHGRAQTAAQIADLEVIPRRAGRLPGPDATRRWTSRRSSPDARRRADRRARAYQHPGRRARQALRGRRGDPGGRDQRDLHAQPAASGIGQRRRRDDHRRPAARDRPGRVRARRRADRADRHDPRGAARGAWRTATSTRPSGSTRP